MKNPWGRQEQPGLRVAVVAVATLLVGFLVYRQIGRWRGDVVTAWVPAVDVAPGTRLTPEQLTPIQARQRALPKDVVLDSATIERSEVLRPKAAGSIFVAGDLREVPPPRDPGLLAAMPEGRVLMTYRFPGLPIAALSRMLRRGDRFDVFAGRRGREPLHMARDVIFMGWIRPPRSDGDSDEDDGVGDTLAETFTDAAQSSIGAPPARPGARPILLGVRPEDVRRLVWVQSVGLRLSVVFHGRTEVESGELLTFPAEPRPRADQIELILGASRSRVPLENLR